MIYFIIFMLILLGTYSIAAHILKLPPHSTSKGIRVATKSNSNMITILTAVLMRPIIKLIAPLIRLEPLKEKRLKVSLDRAEIPLSPREYYARSIGMAGLTLLGGSLLVLTAVRNTLPVVIILSVIVYYHFNGEINDRLKAKDKLIESELPKFIRAIVRGLKTENDIIKLLEIYVTIAGKGLKYDIEVLIVDLKSGSFEDGMLDFEKRLGNAYISRLSKALISINRGDNQDAALNHLLSDMAVLAKESMQRELSKRPGRVKLMVIPIVIVGIFTLFYVIGVHLFNSLGGIM